MKLLPSRSRDASATGGSRSFETRCESCNVSFPAETRKCLHCGQRLGARAEVARTPGGGFVELEGEEEVARWAPLRMVMGVLWVVIVLVLSLVRACWEGGG